jgi:glycerol-3-phosphate acyltransferase PlsY
MVRVITLKEIFLFVGMLLSYLIGCIPTAYILVKVIKRQDIRRIGSGNVGATNAARVLGKPMGFFVLIVDMLKGIIPVIFIADRFLERFYFPNPDVLRLILGVLAIIGHNWSVFLNFRGGKGVATTFGVLFGLGLKVSGLVLVLISCVIIWVMSLLFSRIVSLASILTAIFLPIFMIYFRQKKEFILISLILSLFIILRHIPNIKRILTKKEPHI